MPPPAALKKRPLTTERKIAVRALANEWISEHFPINRKELGHTAPVSVGDECRIELITWRGKKAIPVGALSVNGRSAHLADGTTVAQIRTALDAIRKCNRPRRNEIKTLRGDFYDFHFGDGVGGAKALADGSVDLLLTDPPYGISSAYGCEKQVPRRLRKDGRDFIMPKGYFGDWDVQIPEPKKWTAAILPKVKGWAVIFCAHNQIADYEGILKTRGFVAVGAMVWQKTNPVPFNHTHKPINAWEAIVVGKRPGTPFNGRVVHNVFKYKSPSPHQRIHPTQKPLDLIAEFVRLFSPQGGFVLDPFAGSATTVIAAASERRRVIAFENDAEVFAAASGRIAESGFL